MSATLLNLIDKYLADLPAERDLVQAQEVRDLLLDIRLTFMVLGDEEAPAGLVSTPALPPGPGVEAAKRVYRWDPKQIPPGLDGTPL